MTVQHDKTVSEPNFFITCNMCVAHSCDRCLNSGVHPNFFTVGGANTGIMCNFHLILRTMSTYS